MTDAPKMTHLLDTAVARVTNFGLALLRNRVDLRLSREEFRYSRISFSQFGEDLAVLRWLDEWFPDAERVYVDAGAFHPIHCSNTLLLNKRGWWGINIDMVPAKVKRFQALRPTDFNVAAALDKCEYRAELVQYEGGLVDQLIEEGKAETRRSDSAVVAQSPIFTTTLNRVLESAPRQIAKVGYLNVDCEGKDLDVLEGFDLRRYAPEVITIEALPGMVAATESYLTERGYTRREQFHFTLLFTRSY